MSGKCIISIGFEQEKFLGITEVKPTEMTRLINQQNAGVLDVRDQGQFKAGHIINAIHTPFALLEDQLDQYNDYKDSPLILYCSNGQQSARACAMLNKAGFKQLYKLAGGISTWNSANLPLGK